MAMEALKGRGVGAATPCSARHHSPTHPLIGTWLLAWPCFWSLAAAAPPGCPPDWHLAALFGAGAVLLRGAGCTINDMWDARLDARVARTAGRPLACGALSQRQALGARATEKDGAGWPWGAGGAGPANPFSISGAVPQNPPMSITPPHHPALLAAQLAAGLGILLQFDSSSVALGAAALPLVALYPLAKRVTDWVSERWLGGSGGGGVMGLQAVRDTRAQPHHTPPTPLPVLPAAPGRAGPGLQLGGPAGVVGRRRRRGQRGHAGGPAVRRGRRVDAHVRHGAQTTPEP